MPKAENTLCHGTYSCGQSYKGSPIINYDSKVLIDLKIPHIMTLAL